MRSVRVIPCLDVDEGRVVKGVNFVDLVDAGDPAELAARYDEEGADEVVFLPGRGGAQVPAVLAVPHGVAHRFALAKAFRLAVGIDIEELRALFLFLCIRRRGHRPQ